MKSVCDHTSVGILVWKDGKLLLIERRNFPFGFAPPAGHTDGISYEEAARKELKEEVGLDATNLRLLLEDRADKPCRRGGSWHLWKIYEANVSGSVAPSPRETKQALWYSKEEIQKLSLRTKDYLEKKITEKDWQENPGLEEVWLGWFNKLKIL